MVYCVAFGCNANSSQGGGIHHFFKFPTDPLLLKKWLVKIKRANFKPTKHSRLCAVHFETTCFERDPETMAALGYAGARVSLKSDAVPSIFPAVEAAFMPSIRRIQASARSESSVGGSRKRSAASDAVGSAAAAAGSASMTPSSSGYLFPSTSGGFTRTAYRKRQRIKVILICYSYDNYYPYKLVE